MMLLFLKVIVMITQNLNTDVQSVRIH